MTGFVSNRQKVLNSQGGMAKILNEYEDLNLTQYADIDVSRLIMNNPNNSEMKVSMDHASEN